MLKQKHSKQQISDLNNMWNDKVLEDQFQKLGSKLPKVSSLEDLLLLVHEIGTCLSELEQSPPKSMLTALSGTMHALVSNELLKHSNTDVRVSVAFCLSEITRITAPEAPYDNDQMKEVFKLKVASFEKLYDTSSQSFDKRVSILETMAACRSSVVMLDLECHELIVEMFLYFLKAIRDFHPEKVFASMESIMSLVLIESEEISKKLLSPHLTRMKMDNLNVTPIARKLGEKVLECYCFSSMARAPNGYYEIVANLLKMSSDYVESNDNKTPVGVILANESNSHDGRIESVHDNGGDSIGNNNGNSARFCSKCGSQFHLRRDCGSCGCFRCGKHGHFAKECPIRRKDTLKTSSKSRVAPVGHLAGNWTTKATKQAIETLEELMEEGDRPPLLSGKVVRAEMRNIVDHLQTSSKPQSDKATTLVAPIGGPDRFMKARTVQQMVEAMKRMEEELHKDDVGEYWSGRTPWEIKEKENEYKIRFDMPGMTSDDVKVWLEGKILVLKGEATKKKVEENGKGEEEEWPAKSYGRYSCRIVLPENVVLEEIKAVVKDGVLCITLPKATASGKILVIDVQ